MREFAALVTTTARQGASEAGDPAARADALALLAEYDAFVRDTSGYDAAVARLRAVEERMRQRGTLPFWHTVQPDLPPPALEPLTLYPDPAPAVTHSL